MRKQPFLNVAMQNVKVPAKASLSKVAIGLVSVIIFFSVLTQRMMISTENSALELLVSQPWTKGLGFVTETAVKNTTIPSLISLPTLGHQMISTSEYLVDTVTEAPAPLNITTAVETVVKKHTKKRSHPSNFNETLIGEISNYHPHVSPRVGTDISKDQQLSILRCPNQSKCIIPELQLEVKLKVYFCRHPARQGVRFYYLMKEGLLLHPNVELVEEKDMYTADYVIYLPGSAPWHKTECTNTSLADKMIVMDEFDGHTLFAPRTSKELMVQAYGDSMMWYFMYFKRSFVLRKDGKFLKYPHFNVPHVYPMTYALAEVYLQHNFNFDRSIEILCTLRGSKSMSTRQRVQEWVTEYGVDRKVKNIISSQVNKESRTKISKDYFDQMYNSSIIVTVNPANWEGDFRLWESFATGALIMVDPLFVPHSYPLIDGVHVVYYSNLNKTDLYSKLDYYREHPEEARSIAIEGYLHTMKYHRTVNMVDYVLRSAHLKRAMANNMAVPNYTFTAQYINHEAKKQEKLMLHHDRPGTYHGHVE